MQDLEKRQQGRTQLRVLESLAAGAAAQVGIRDIGRYEPGCQLRLEAAVVRAAGACQRQPRLGGREIRAADLTCGREE
jgi:hypothetical protein